MEANFYQFSDGSFNCMSVSDGGHSYELGTLFSNVPQEQVEQTLIARGLPTGGIFTPYTCLFVDNGSQSILVDGVLPARFFCKSNESIVIKSCLMRRK